MPTPHLAPSTTRVLEYLTQTGATSQPNAAIAVDTGYSVPTIKDALSALEDAGLIEVERCRRNRHAGDTTGRTLRVAKVGV